MTDAAGQIAINLRHVQERLAQAAERAGRIAADIRLVGVTKGEPIEHVRLLVEAGCHDLGESRPQELWTKSEALADLPIRWHLIGHLQRNKLRRTLPLLALIHSVDSARLLAAINEEAAGLGRNADVLLEVNISAEADKTGLAPVQVPPLLDTLADYPHVSLRGLMGMASLTGGEESASRDFRRLRELREQYAATAPAGISLDELSMGMSGDFELAIAEGATLVRVGSALFEGVKR